MAKKSFIVYLDIKDVVAELTDEEAGKLFRAMVVFADTGEVMQLPEKLHLLFINIRSQIRRDSAKWEDIVSMRSAAGKKGMAKRWGKNNKITKNNKNNNAYQTITNITVNDNVNENVTVNDIKKENEKKEITPQDFFEIAVRNRVNPSDVREIYDDLDFKVSEGRVKPYKDIRRAVDKWTKNAIKWGNIQQLTEAEMQIIRLQYDPKLKNLEPDLLISSKVKNG